MIVFAALPGLIECSFPGWWWQTTANGPRPPPSTKGTTKNSLLDRPFLPQLQYCIFLFTFDLWWCLFGRTASSRSTGKFNLSLFVPNQTLLSKLPQRTSIEDSISIPNRVYMDIESYKRNICQELESAGHRHPGYIPGDHSFTVQHSPPPTQE